METELTSILDEVAPLKTSHRTGPRKAKKWLSPEAIDAKKQRRRLERRWKAFEINNGLHLNPSKSEAMVFYNPRSKPLAALAESIGTVSVAGSSIKLQTSIKNVGVYLDSKMSFDKQVSETCKACYFHIRALRHIRTSLTIEASKP